MSDLGDGSPGARALTADSKYRLLLQIAQRISGTLDLDEILNHLLDTILEAVPYDAAGVFVLTREDPLLQRGHPRQMVAGMASRGFPPRPLEDDSMLRLGLGIIGHVIRTGEFVVAPDVRLEPRYVEGRPETRSEIAVPIVDGPPHHRRAEPRERRAGPPTRTPTWRCCGSSRTRRRSPSRRRCCTAR